LEQIMILTEAAIPHHSEIDSRYTWNAASVFPSVEAWEAEYEAVAAALPGLMAFQDHLVEGAAVVSAALEAVQNLARRIGILSVYAGMDYAVDTQNQPAAKRYGRIQSLSGQFAAASAFVGPELLVIGEKAVRGWLAEDPQLVYLGHYVDNLFRKQAHVRTAEVEELLGSLAAPFANVEMTASMLTDADFKFPAATGIDGGAQPVTQGTLGKILAGADREARRTAWEGYADTYLAYKNTLAANLLTSIKYNVFSMRARRHASTLEMALAEHNTPVEVFHNLIATFRKNLPTWQRYWEVRRKALGVDILQPYDIWAPLAGNRPTIAYEDAVDHICRGLAPMGEDYVATVRRGCLEERWVDAMPCQGKMGGAFSSGSSGTHPFIMMSYTGEVFSLSTLAHELGHSMHSYLTWQNQPVLYSDYGMFVAEVASNFHQAMVRAHLLANEPDPAFQIAVLEEAMSNFHRYFFIMPTLARFELEVHQREERGEGMSADDMIGLMADLFAEGYGDGVHVDRERTGITWATFGHLYVDYYVFQYATGISGANALAQRILSGTSGAVEDYLSFLKAGDSLYPVDALKLAGVDLTSPAPVEAAFEVLAGLVDRLEMRVGG
jgi:oligoendopeptidase F